MTSATRPTSKTAESEAYVLGCVLRQPDLWPEVSAGLPAEAFSIPKNREIFEAMAKIAERGDSPDLVMVAKESRLYTKSAEIEDYTDLVGGTGFLSQHIAAVRDAWRTREIIRTCTAIVELGHQGEIAADDLIDRLQRDTYRLSISTATKKITHIAEIIPDVMTEIDGWSSGEIQKKLVTTGFADLDYAISGFLPGEVVIIAGRPGRGKSQLALQVAMNSGKKDGRKVLVVSLEMSKIALGRRALVTEANIDGMKIKQQRLTSDDWDRLTKAQPKLAASGLYFLDDPTVSVADLRALCRQMAAGDGLHLLLVDYLQLMEGDGRKDRNREQEVAAISRGLKALAMEIEIPVVVLSQLSRMVEQRADQEPKLSDLRESGALEQDADMVLFVHHAKTTKTDAGGPRIIVGKYRDGKAGRVDLAWNNGQWRDLAHESEQYAPPERQARPVAGPEQDELPF